MASKAAQQPNGSQQVEAIELNKKNAINFLKKLVEKGQDSGHYTLQDSHLIYEALRFLGYDDQGDKTIPKPEMEEKDAFQILIGAVTASQKLGHCYTVEESSNAFRVVVYITKNIIKSNDEDDSTTETGEEGKASTSKSRLPLKA